MILIASAMWLLSGRGNKHAHTHAHTLFCELHWQALIPALAYERRQLEAVAVASVAANACCGFHSDGSSCVLSHLCVNIRRHTPSVCQPRANSFFWNVFFLLRRV